MGTQDGHHHNHRRMTKSELGERLHVLQHSSEPIFSEESREKEFQAVLHELEVYQIELEMQNRELKDSQRALEESYERYVNLYDFAPIGYVTLTSQGIIKEINLTAASMLGVERKWLEDRSLAPWISGAELTEFRSHVKKSFDSDEKVTSVLHLRRKDKQLIPIELSSTLFIGSPTGENLLRTTITDLTERRNAEEERDRFFDLSTDLLCAVNENGFFRRLNPAWEYTLGYTLEELLARPYLDFLHPKDRTRAATEFKKLFENKEVSGFQNRYLRKDGSTVWLSWSGVISGSTFYGIARDTTVETLEKHTIKNQFSWLTELVQSLPVPLLLQEVDTGKMLSISQEATNILEGLSSEDCFFVDARGNRLEEKQLPRYKAAKGNFLNGEEMIWHTPLKNTHLQTWSRIVPAKYDHPPMVLLAFQDISNLKQKEAQLQESVEKLNFQRELRENFVSGLSHDLRTPLTAARLGVEVLAKKIDNPAFQKNSQRILGSIDRMDRMINDLLDANRIHAGEKLPMKIQRCDLTRLVKSTIESLSLIHRQPITVLSGEKILALCGRSQIRRVIENLVNNAVKYGTPNRPITVKLEKTEDALISLSVHNFGNPICQKDQSTLFEQFRRTESAEKSEEKGWGVGLTLVRGIAEAHGGTISVHSTAFQGTTFTFTFPFITE